MFDEDDKETGYAVFLAITLAIVVSLAAVALAIGSAIGSSERAPAAPKAAKPSVLRVVAVAYFEVGRADVPADVATLMAPAVRAARLFPDSKLMVSGYHDASGDAAANAELAKRRAQAVRDALIAAGVGEDRIELARPVATLGGIDPNEARRVEVTLR